MAPVVGFAGMTHLGLVSAAAAGEKGFAAICFDADSRHIAELQARRLGISEPGLEELLEKNSACLSFTSKAEDLARCDLIYVAADVPTDDEGRSDLRPIDVLLDTVFRQSRPDSVIVVLSQVPPGFSRARQRVGRQLFYQVETLIFGQAVERALHPERYIVGCADPAQPLPGYYAPFLEKDRCPLLKMRFESAELSKISINMCLVGSISVANTIAELCEQIGADWSEIAPALRLDRRIGQHAYLAPGLGIAGGNLERDLASFRTLAARHGTDPGVVDAWLTNSRRRRDWPLQELSRRLGGPRGDAVIAVLGLAYKQDTASTKNSPSIALIRSLRKNRVRAYDPAVAASSVASEHPAYHAAASELDACAGADAVAVMTPWRQFARLDARKIAAVMRGRIVIDPYRALDRAAWTEAGFDYCTLGAPAGAGR